MLRIALLLCVCLPAHALDLRLMDTARVGQTTLPAYSIVTLCRAEYHAGPRVLDAIYTCAAPSQATAPSGALRLRFPSSAIAVHPSPPAMSIMPGSTVALCGAVEYVTASRRIDARPCVGLFRGGFERGA